MTVSPTPKAKTAGWGVIAMLAAAQFIMVLDTTVINVSITQVAADLNTPVVALQTAITMYTMAGLSPRERAAVTKQYADAQIMALKVAFAALAFFSLLALWYVQSLPNRAEGAKPADEPSPAGEAAGVNG
jgi:hypothetical protein